MLLYYITDRRQFPGDEATRCRRLLEKIAEAAACGVDYIQLREKDLPARELEILARQAVQIVRENIPLRTENCQLATEKQPPGSKYGGRKTSLLINSRIDVALAVAADGVHLRSADISPLEVRKIWRQCGAGAPARENSQPAPAIAVSCHTASEIASAAKDGADFVVVAPVFEKRESPSMSPLGLEGLRQACRHEIPVLALGGVTLENAAACLNAGAAGIAAIRLFQENEIAEVVRSLRG